jgi:hypothetical protein
LREIKAPTLFRQTANRWRYFGKYMSFLNEQANAIVYMEQVNPQYRSESVLYIVICRPVAGQRLGKRVFAEIGSG